MSSPEILAERWRMATVRPQRFTDGTMTWTNSRDVERIIDTIEDLGARLVDEGVDADELAGLNEIAGTILDVTIRERLLAWAQAVETRRAARHPAAA